MKPILKLKRLFLSVLLLLFASSAWSYGLLSHDFGECEDYAGIREYIGNVSEMNPDGQRIDLYFTVVGRLSVSYLFDPESDTLPYFDFSLYEVRDSVEYKYPPIKQHCWGVGYCDSTSFLNSGRYICRIQIYASFFHNENNNFFFGIVTRDLAPGMPLDKPIGLIHGPAPDYGSNPGSGLTSSRSYLLSKQMLSADGTSKLETVSYTDGLGRPIQTVRKGFTPSGADLVDFTDYDCYGYVWRQWKPVPISGYNGAFINNLPLKAGELCEDSRPYAEMDYTAFHPDKPIFSKAPGDAWKEYPITNFSMTNTRQNPVLDCSKYFVTYINSPVRTGSWEDGELSVTQSQDEDSGTSLTFTDKLGRVLLERSVCDTVSYDTYYVYDTKGDLCYVLPPAMNGDISPSLLEQYAYSYEYDALHRLTGKKLPGCARQRYVYDSADRIIFSQDGKQALKCEWTFSIPDNYGREALRGICDIDYPPAMSSVVKAAFTGSDGISKTGYSLTGVSLTPASLLTVNYYDTYDFLQIPNLSVCANELTYRSANGYDSRYVNPSAPESSAYGKLTGSRVFVPETSMEIVTAYYYDDRGNVVQSRSTNHLGGYDMTCFSYTFSGNLKTRMHIHSAPGKAERKEVYTYAYDQGNRLVSVTHKLDEHPVVTLMQRTYDEFCRLSGTSLHNGRDTTHYAYNIRDWMTDIAGDKFEQRLHYTDGPGTPRYNGNISGMTWKSGDKTTERGYKFAYDNLNRLMNAEYGEGVSLAANQNHFNEQVTGYDKMGNILGLKRFGQTSANGYGVIDSLSLSYTGNQLQTVKDSAVSSVYGNGFEFKDGADMEAEYEYDANGNLTKDLNKKIADIQYNVLNLPSRVLFEDGNSVSYVYDANGTKLRTMHLINGDTLTTDYCGNAIYENGVAKTLQTEAGYVSLTDNRYHYYIRDHQGNNRVVMDQDGTVKEVSHYYPFGGMFASSQSVQPYKYNGKELDTKNGLNWHDYGARHYDAAIGRWCAVDPRAEKYSALSPYNYCGNNPVNYVDLKGDSLSLADMQNLDKSIGTNIVAEIVDDLQTLTGLTITVGNDGVMTYAKDANGNPIVATMTDANGNSMQAGSATARTAITNALDHSDMVDVVRARWSGVSPLKRNTIQLGINQIEGFIKGTVGLDNRTLGWGMTLTHELHHTLIGGGLKDNYTSVYPGDVVTRMNTIRSELNSQGGNYGQRLDYAATKINGYNYVPFDRAAQGQTSLGLLPLPINRHIKFK